MWCPVVTNLTRWEPSARDTGVWILPKAWFSSFILCSRCWVPVPAEALNQCLGLFSCFQGCQQTILLMIWVLHAALAQLTNVGSKNQKESGTEKLLLPLTVQTPSLWGLKHLRIVEGAEPLFVRAGLHERRVVKKTGLYCKGRKSAARRNNQSVWNILCVDLYRY